MDGGVRMDTWRECQRGRWRSRGECTGGMAGAAALCCLGRHGGDTRDDSRGRCRRWDSRQPGGALVVSGTGMGDRGRRGTGNSYAALWSVRWGGEGGREDSKGRVYRGSNTGASKGRVQRGLLAWDGIWHTWEGGRARWGRGAPSWRQHWAALARRGKGNLRPLRPGGRGRRWGGAPAGAAAATACRRAGSGARARARARRRRRSGPASRRRWVRRGRGRRRRAAGQGRAPAQTSGCPPSLHRLGVDSRRRGRFARTQAGRHAGTRSCSRPPAPRRAAAPASASRAPALPTRRRHARRWRSTLPSARV